MISRQIQLLLNNFFLTKRMSRSQWAGFFMHRFFVPFPFNQEIIVSPGDLYHQIVHVFRAKIGERITLFSEWTEDFVYEIGAISKKWIILSKKESLPNKFCTPWNRLLVLQAYPNKLSTLELLVQKFTELWVEKVVFWKSEHTQMQDISDAKKSRIESIACEALEQCGANISLQIEFSSQTLQNLLKEYSDYTHIVGHYEGKELPSISQEKPTALWIGPEGGWSTKEKEFLEKQNLTLWKFNHRILRLETAAIVGAGILLS